MSTGPDVRTTVRTIKAGADDLMTKPVASDDLFRAIEKAFAHHQTLRDLKDKLDSVRACLGRLTPRERESSPCRSRQPSKQVARELGYSERTIKAHRHRVMDKCGLGRCRNLCPLPSGLASWTARPPADRPPRQISTRFRVVVVLWDNRNSLRKAYV